MAIDFPNSPFAGQQFSAAGVLWQWDGFKWTALGNTLSVPDAPTDGQTYGRKSAAWAVVTSGGGGIGDAPNDSTSYARRVTSGVGAWTHLTHNDITDWASASSSVIVNATPPVSPNIGALWFDSIGLGMYIWYNDGVTSQWIPANP